MGNAISKHGLISAKDLMALDIDTEEQWIWYPYIAVDSVTVLLGTETFPKILLLSDLVLRLTKGIEMPVETDHKKVSGCVVFHSQEPEYEGLLRLAYEKQGGDINLISFLNDKHTTVADIMMYVKKKSARLAIINPLQSFIHNYHDMSDLCHLSYESDCAIVMLLSKRDYIDDMVPANSWFNIGRCSGGRWILSKHQSNLAPEGKNIRFEITEGLCIKWIV